jgi:hypothetical protein
MNTLPLEVIEYIAKLDNEIWYKLVQVYKFLSEKNNVDDMKQRFLLCSTMSNDVEYDHNVKYKYNSKFHIDNEVVYTPNKQYYKLVYYLPNGDLHTFENPCVTYCHYIFLYLNIWFKDNKIHRDGDNPAAIFLYLVDDTDLKTSFLREFPIFDHIHDKNYQVCDYTKMWFKNNNLCRDNDLPVIVKQEHETHKEWRKNNILHRDNDLPAIINNIGQYWYREGKIHRDDDNPAIIRNNGSQDFYKNEIASYGIMSNGSRIYYFPEN